MNIPLFLTHEPIATRDIFTLSFEDLRDRLQRLYTAQEQTVTAINNLASGASQSRESSLKLSELENHFNTIWQALEITVDAISLSAMLAQYRAGQLDKLADAACEGLLLLQAVTPGQESVPLWFAQCGGIVAQAASLIDDDRLFAEKMERTCQCFPDNL